MKIVAKAVLHRREMNQVEAKYHRHLQDLMTTGAIRWALFEPWKLRLADNTSYCPDFIVVKNDGTLEAHEVKTWWKGKHGTPGRSGWTEDSRAKIKVAAEMHPLRFIAATLMPDQSWQFEQFGEDREEELPLSATEVLDRVGDMLECKHSLPEILTAILRLQKVNTHVQG